MDEKETKLIKLYTQKGELTTRIEITQNQLAQVNKMIIEELNKPKVLLKEETTKKEK